MAPYFRTPSTEIFISVGLWMNFLTEAMHAISAKWEYNDFWEKNCYLWRNYMNPKIENTNRTSKKSTCCCSAVCKMPQVGNMRKFNSTKRQRFKASPWEGLEEACSIWPVNARSQNIWKPSFRESGCNNFHRSDSWLDRWKKRKIVSLKTVSGKYYTNVF